jgi:hypothetical protein
MNRSKAATFAVYKSTEFQGFVKALTYQQAVARAHGRFGICDVELCTDRKAQPKERRDCNVRQQAKQSRRYPTPGFEARRSALIAELVG